MDLKLKLIYSKFTIAKQLFLMKKQQFSPEQEQSIKEFVDNPRNGAISR